MTPNQSSVIDTDPKTKSNREEQYSHGLVARASGPLILTLTLTLSLTLSLSLSLSLSLTLAH